MKPTNISLKIVTTLLIMTVAIISISIISYQAIMPQTITTDVQFIADFSETKTLVDLVDNVFVGQVISQKGIHQPSGFPETLFKVEVVQNIKGELAKTVSVNQVGGLEEGQLILVENDPLLTPGQTYLFATKVGGEGTWHTLVSGYGDILLSDLSEIKRQQVIQKFENVVRQKSP